MKVFINLLLIWISSIHSQQVPNRDYSREETLIWCTVNIEETYKCENLSIAVEQEKKQFDNKPLFQIKCRQAFNKEACMTLLDEETADIVSVDAGEVFVGGRYHSLLPIMQEVHERDTYYYSVAVVKKNTLSDVTSLYHLRNKKACFPDVGSLAGWVIPIETLMVEGGLEIIDCNNHVKSAIRYFGPSCAVNALIDKYNPAGDNSDKLCELCIGQIPGGRCTSADPYAGYDGAFKCLVEAGDIAFLKHTTVAEMTSTTSNFVSVKSNDFELLCKDGSRQSIQDYERCYWGRIPSDAIMVSSAKQNQTKTRYQEFLKRLGKVFSVPDSNKPIFGSTPSTRNSAAPQIQNQNSNFSLFESVPRYGTKHNLLVQDQSRGLQPLEEERQSHAGYLGESLNAILRVRQCTVNRMTLCVTSDPELEKCSRMKTALKSQLLKPEMDCYKGKSHIHCMQAIRSRIADIAVLDAGDVYTAGLRYDEIPFISEVYNLGVPEYYVVAVAKEEDPSTELTYLRGKYTCHTGIFTAGGWIIPLAYLISNGWIRTYGCDSVHAAAEYFGKSCVPGALSPEYVSDNSYDNLCHLCHGYSSKYCRRDASEDYFGYTGAFRCLVEGGGDVAFLKHTTVYENTDGKRKEWWARNTLNEDYQLLCPDGTRSTLDNYQKCNMGKVKANAIVTRGGDLYNETEINAYINLFVYAQQFFGRKDDESFSMFLSPPPFTDLIFQDATQQLKVIKPENRYYDKYLGNDFMRARRLVDCHAGASVTLFSIKLIVTCVLFVHFR